MALNDTRAEVMPHLAQSPDTEGKGMQTEGLLRWESSHKEVHPVPMIGAGLSLSLSVPI